MSSCWLWEGARNTDGYGYLMVSGRYERVHREAYRVWIGPIPEGLSVLHHCDTPPCYNPDHLFVGTQADNMRDAMLKGRKVRNPSGLCKRGHPLDGIQSGGRFCRECKRGYNRARWHRLDYGQKRRERQLQARAVALFLSKKAQNE